METKEELVCNGNISTYQCDRILVKYNTLAYNLDGINLSSLLLIGWIYRIAIFTSQYLLPIKSNTLASNFDVINPIFIFVLT